MTQEISRLVDGDLDPHEIDRTIKACAGEDGLRAWHTYHVIGEVMRGESTRPSGVLGRVSGVLDKEPHHGRFGGGVSRFGSVARMSLAAAASVATIGVVGWIGFQQGGTTTGPAVARGPAPVTGNLATATVAGTDAAAPAKAVATAPAPASAPGAVHSQELHDYLVAHRQTPSSDFYRPVAAKGP